MGDVFWSYTNDGNCHHQFIVCFPLGLDFPLIRNLDWAHELCKVPPELLLQFATGMIADKCMLFVPKKRGKKKVITSFHRKRIILMRKRRKLAKSHIFVSEKTAQILHVEELICESHRQEKLHDEEIAVTKIKMDPNYFFRYAKKT